MLRLSVLLAAAAVALSTATANADTIGPLPTPPGPGGGGQFSGGAGTDSGSGVGFSPPSLAPAAAGIFLCPGVGAAGNSFGGGGGYCNFNFNPIYDPAGNYRGNMHTHCEWGGFTPVVQIWNCWRVFPGQPDHPALPDPDIIPDGYGVPYAIRGPTPDNQFPPPGLVPYQELIAGPPQPLGPIPGPPPGSDGSPGVHGPQPGPTG